MKKKLTYLFLFFCGIILLACKGGEEDTLSVPDNVLSEEKYIKLLVDFSLAESAGNLNVKNLSGLKFDSAYAFNPLKENNVSQAQYDTTVAFYSKHPKQYKKIFEEVLTALSKMQATRNAVKKDTVAKKDSTLTIKKDSLLKKEIALKKDTLSKKPKTVKPKKKKRKKKAR